MVALKRLLVIGSCGLSAAAPLVPGTARCLRVADHDFNRLFADQLDGSGNAGRRSTEADCDHACNNKDSEHSSWCIGFEFRDTEKGTCELYDDCSTDSPAPSPVAKAQEAPAKEAQAAPAKVERCMKVSDHDFNALFADQLDGSGNAGRKSTKADCDHACNNADSEHSSWCIGFEFRDTEKGTCELYEDCSKKAATPAASPTATEHSTPFAAEAAQTASPNVKDEHRCLRVATSDFDTYYDEHIERRYNWGGRDARETTDEDCKHTCTKAVDGHDNWCVGFEFSRDGNGTCELYDDCSKKADSPAPSPVVAAQEAPVAQAAPAKEAQAAPAKVERCMKVSDHDFNALFADQLDGSGNAGRKSTKADCDHACNNADSEHSSWCIGFEFRDTEKGTCELYADCSEAAASPTTATAKEHSTPFAIESAQRAIMDSGHVCVSLKDGLSEDWCYTACPNALCPPEAAGDCMCGMDASGVAPSPTAVSCLRVANHDFDRWFNDHDDRRYNWGEHPIRNATEADCSHACDKVVNGHVNWCVDFEFRPTEMGMCELYADCSQVAASSTPIESARVAQAAPPKAARCLRLRADAALRGCDALAKCHRGAAVRVSPRHRRGRLRRRLVRLPRDLVRQDRAAAFQRHAG